MSLYSEVYPLYPILNCNTHPPLPPSIAILILLIQLYFFFFHGYYCLLIWNLFIRFIILLPMLQWKLNENSVCGWQWSLKYLLWMNIFSLKMFKLIIKTIISNFCASWNPPISIICFLVFLYSCQLWTCLHYQFEYCLHLSPMIDPLVSRPFVFLVFLPLFNSVSFF